MNERVEFIDIDGIEIVRIDGVLSPYSKWVMRIHPLEKWPELFRKTDNGRGWNKWMAYAPDPVTEVSRWVLLKETGASYVPASFEEVQMFRGGIQKIKSWNIPEAEAAMILFEAQE